MLDTIETTTAPIASSRERMERQFRDATKFTLEADALEEQRDKEIERIRAEYDKKIQDKRRRALRLALAVDIFADRYRTELTNGGKRKSFKNAVGMLKWYLVEMLKIEDSTNAVLQRIKAAGKAHEYIVVTITERLDRKALRKAWGEKPEDVERFGLTFEKKEFFAEIPDLGKRRFVRHQGERTLHLRTKD